MYVLTFLVGLNSGSSTVSFVICLSHLLHLIWITITVTWADVSNPICKQAERPMAQIISVCFLYWEWRDKYISKGNRIVSK